MKQVLLSKMEAETKHTSEKLGASTVPGPATEAPAARNFSLLLPVHEEIVKENAEEEQHLASPSSVQVQSYLSEMPIGRNENALTYWRINKDRYPELAPLARAYLSAPCTNIDRERLLSWAGQVVDEKRSCLFDDKAEMLLFVKRNLPLMSK